MGTVFEDMAELARRVQSGDEHALAQLVEANRGLVVSTARKLRGCGVEGEDLEQEGTIGLILAARRFDPELGAWFSYARLWVRAKMLDAIQERGGAVRLPRYLHGAEAAIRDAERVAGRGHTDEELAEVTGLEVRLVSRIRSRARVVASTDAPVGEGPATRGELTPEVVDDHERDVARLVTERLVEEAGLSGLQREFALQRWGVGRSRGEVATRLELSLGGARTLEWETVARLRLTAERMGLVEPDPGTSALRARLQVLAALPAGQRPTVVAMGKELGVHPSRVRGELRALGLATFARPSTLDESGAPDELEERELAQLSLPFA